MRYSVVLPAHNEAAYIKKALEALLSQKCLPQEVIVVDDHSTDQTPNLVKQSMKKNSCIKLVQKSTIEEHQPGAKVVEAFLKGKSALTRPYDVLVKLDADIELPENYFSELAEVFKDKSVGIAGGLIVEKTKSQQWRVNHPMHQDHVRGAIKAYSKACYQAIGGLRAIMGWDTLDEHLARFNGYRVVAVSSLHAKHHRPLGRRYSTKAFYDQGRAFYLLRYGSFLSILAILKHAWLKKSMNTLLFVLYGYLSALLLRPQRVVTKKEGLFIRNYRKSQIKNKLKSF